MAQSTVNSFRPSKMLKCALILVLVPAFALATVQISQCDNPGTGVLPTWIAIDGCNETECVVFNGSTLTVTGEGVPVVGADTLTTALTAFVDIGNDQTVTVPLPLPDPIADGCNTVNGGCPLEAFASRTVHIEYFLNSQFSGVSLDLEISFINGNDQQVFCFRTPVIIRNPDP